MSPEHRLIPLLERHAEAWNNHDLDLLMSYFSDDCGFQASGGEEAVGARFEARAAVRAAFRDVMEGMPDAQWGGARHFILGESYGVSEWTLTGTLPDGSRMETDGCDFLTFRGDEIILKNSYRKQRPPLPPHE